MKALVFYEFGGPEVLRYEVVDDPIPAPDQIVIATEFIGLNYADIYRRKGNYHLKGKPPYIAGYEAAGTVIDPNGHAEFRSGDRVAFADAPFANAERVAVPVSHVIPLRGHITTLQAASSLLQGLTAQYLAYDSYRIRRHDVVLIHAAAGGVGGLLIQMAKMQGAVVIGLTSSAEKEKRIVQLGADAAFNLHTNWINQVRSFTQGRGVDVTYDSVGSTLADSLAVTRDLGSVVFYGMSGGNPPAVDPRNLMDRSQTLTGGDLWSYLTSREERIRRSEQLFEWITSGQVQLSTPTIFPLSEGAEAHRFLESGKSTGKVLLTTKG